VERHFPWSAASGWRIYVIAAAALLAAVALRYALDPWLHDRFPVTTLFGAIALVALLRGVWAGVATTLIGYGIINFFFVEPRGRLGWIDAAQAAGFASFLFTSACLIALAWAARHYAMRTAREKELLAVTLAGIGDGVITCDADGRITMLNKVAAALTGWREDEARGVAMESVFRIVNEATRAPADNPVRRAIREGRVTGLANHTLLIAKDGREIPIDDSAAPIVQNARVVGAVLVFRDITERKQAFEAMATADRRKTEFLAVLGHELRNPLAAVVSAAHVLQHSPDEQSVRECADLILRQTKHLTRLVDDLLDLSRIETGSIDLRLRRVKLDEIVTQAAETSAAAIESAGHSLHVELPQPPVELEADDHRLAQVLANLLINAARYSPQPGEIRLDCDVIDGQLKMAVTDHGMGIRPQDMQKLFRLFTRLDGAAGRSDGLGIGLSLSRSLVELHGGSIAVHSDGEGKGSCFTVMLPLPNSSEEKA
jgi:PAS domain S-box-containing protein